MGKISMISIFTIVIIIIIIIIKQFEPRSNSWPHKMIVYVIINCFEEYYPQVEIHVCAKSVWICLLIITVNCKK